MTRSSCLECHLAEDNLISIQEYTHSYVVKLHTNGCSSHI